MPPDALLVLVVYRLPRINQLGLVDLAVAVADEHVALLYAATYPLSGIHLHIRTRKLDLIVRFTNPNKVQNIVVRDTRDLGLRLVSPHRHVTRFKRLRSIRLGKTRYSSQ